MYKSFYRLLLISITFIAFFAACKKEDNLYKPILGLEGDTWVKNDLDVWLYENFTKPFNMAVKYRWDGTESNISYTLVPPSLEKVKPIMEAVKQAWIDVYISQKGEAFIKKFAPKEYMLIGSLRYNASSVTLGEAEDGLKVTIFNVDAFEKTDREKLKRVMKTIHHEFTHILNQTVMFPIEFRQISPGDYTGSWTSVLLTDARNKGFISSYAMSDPLEDFAEMVSIMITEGKDGLEAIKNSISNPDGKANLITKEDIVVKYMKQVWDIDIYALMDKFREVLDEMAPLPPPLVSTQLGFGKTYTSLTVTPLTQTGLSQDFMDAFNNANTHLKTYGGRYLEAFVIYFDATDKIRLRINYRNSSNSALNADFAYGMSLSANDEATLTYMGPPVENVSANNNARAIEIYVIELTKDYLLNKFKLYWPDGKPSSTAPFMAGFKKSSDANSFFFGVMGN